MRLKYTRTGLWLEQNDDMVRIGLSEKGQDDVGEVMYVELSKFRDVLQVGDDLLSVEGAKAVTELVAPVSGTVQKVHEDLEDDTSLLNSKKREDNWIIELTDVLGFDSAEFSDDPWFGREKPEAEAEDE